MDSDVIPIATPDQAASVFAVQPSAADLAQMQQDTAGMSAAQSIPSANTDGTMNITVRPMAADISARPDDISTPTPDQAASVFAPASPSFTPQSTEAQVVSSFIDPDTGKPYKLSDIENSPLYSPGMFAGKNVVTDPKSLGGEFGASAAGSVAKGATDVSDAMAQLAAKGAVGLGADPSLSKLITLQAQIANADYNQNWKGRAPGVEAPVSEQLLNGLGAMAMPIPGVGPLSGAIGKLSDAALAKVGVTGASALARGVQTAIPAAVTNAVVAPAMAPSTVAVPGQVTSFPDQKLQQAAGGAITGAVTSPISQVAGKALTKGINALKGVNNPAYQDFINLLKAHNLYDNFTAADITKDPVMEGIQGGLKKVPDLLGGMKGQAAKLNDKLQAKAADASRQQSQKMIDAKFSNVGEIIKAASDPLDRRNDAAKNILERMSNDKDFHDIIKTSATKNEVRAAILSDKNYQDVSRLAGDDNVPLKNGIKALNEIIGDLGTVKGNFAKKAMNDATALRNDLLSGGNERSDFITRQYFDNRIGRPTNENPIPPNTYMSIRHTVSAIESASETLKGRGDDYTAMQYDKVASALDKDLDIFGKTSKNADLAAAANKADNYYKSTVIPMKALQLNKEGAAPDALYNNFVKAGNGYKGQALYDALDGKGQAAVRAGMVKDAFTGAIDPDTGKFDPSSFTKSLNDIQDTRNVFFKGTDKFEMDGIKKIMFHGTQPDGGKYANPLLIGAGIADVGMSGGAAIMHHPIASVGALLAPAVVNWMLSSPQGKRFLLAASDLQPNSPAMAALIPKIQAALPKALGNISGNYVNQNNQAAGDAARRK